MDQTPPSRLPTPHEAARQFATWLRAQLDRRQYGDRGGLSRFAADSGLSKNTVSRLLRAENAPDPLTVRLVAEALSARIEDAYLHAGLLTPHDITAIRNRSTHPTNPITTDEILDTLGITDPVDAATITAVIDAAQRRPRDKEAGN